jgi:nucleotide-binding universal stress UspA family protein
VNGSAAEKKENKIDGSKTMFRRILVPLDGSERAERALPVAARLARFSGGSITLLRILASPIELMGRSTEPPVPESSWASIARASDYLARLAASKMLTGIETTAEVFKGIPAPAIIAAARSSQADIIVICSHGYTGATRRALGSVAEKVAFHAPIPVLVLHEGRTALPDTQPGVFHPLRTLLALDGSARAEEAIEPAAYLTAALAAPSQGGLHLMRVVQADTTNNSMVDQPGSETMLQMASSYLSSMVDRLRERPLASAGAYLLPATWSVALDDDVAGAIARAAGDGESGAEGGIPGGCDIVAIATHGVGELPRGAMESITERVLTSTRLPLLIVRSLDIMERSNFTWDETALFTI